MRDDAPTYTAEQVRAAVEAERARCVAVCQRWIGRGYRDDGSMDWLAHDNALRTVIANMTGG